MLFGALLPAKHRALEIVLFGALLRAKIMLFGAPQNAITSNNVESIIDNTHEHLLNSMNHHKLW